MTVRLVLWSVMALGVFWVEEVSGRCGAWSCGSRRMVGAMGLGAFLGRGSHLRGVGWKVKYTFMLLELILNILE